MADKSRPILSGAIASVEFGEKYNQWNLEVVKNEELELEFKELADNRIWEIYPDDSDEGMVTREVVADALSEAMSADNFRHDSYMGWAADDLEMDEAINERGKRIEAFRILSTLKLAELREMVNEPFERFAAERSFPKHRPLDITEYLSRVADTKTDLVKTDAFFKENIGRVFCRIGTPAPCVGKVGGQGIKFEGSSVVIPTVQDSVLYIGQGRPGRGIRIYEMPRLTVYASELDGGLQIISIERLLRSTDYWANLHNPIAKWSFGELPNGPLLYNAKTSDEFYDENLAYYEKNIAMLRTMGNIAASAI